MTQALQSQKFTPTQDTTMDDSASDPIVVDVSVTTQAESSDVESSALSSLGSTSEPYSDQSTPATEEADDTITVSTPNRAASVSIPTDLFSIYRVIVLPRKPFPARRGILTQKQRDAEFQVWREKGLRILRKCKMMRQRKDVEIY
jgi:hypothetical protein